MSEIPFSDPTPYVGLPPRPKLGDGEWFQAMEQFTRVFAIRPGERVLMLTDPLLDKRVVDAVGGIAKARGATLTQYMAPSTSLPNWLMPGPTAVVMRFSPSGASVPRSKLRTRPA